MKAINNNDNILTLWLQRVLNNATSSLTCGLLFERSEMLRSLRHYLRAQSLGHHTINRLEERGLRE